jgi:hypothetical protein
VIAVGYDTGYSVFYKVWDSRVSHLVNGKNEMCHFWGDLQIDKFKKITHGICRNPVNNISYLFSFTITYQRYGNLFGF